MKHGKTVRKQMCFNQNENVHKNQTNATLQKPNTECKVYCKNRNYSYPTLLCPICSQIVNDICQKRFACDIELQETIAKK